MLFVLLQRYTFWSNSQPLSTLWIITKCCLYYCKDTLFEAIHNTYLPLNINWYVVCITAKIHFLKQFTTISSVFPEYQELFVLLQRYTFWSNSQRGRRSGLYTHGCLYYCKDTLFKRITTVFLILVNSKKKFRFWSLILIIYLCIRSW